MGHPELVRIKAVHWPIPCCLNNAPYNPGIEQDFRRAATRYDNLAANFLSAMALATAIEVALDLWTVWRRG
jgi:hypothetical protein